MIKRTRKVIIVRTMFCDKCNEEIGEWGSSKFRNADFCCMCGSWLCKDCLGQETEDGVLCKQCACDHEIVYLDSSGVAVVKGITRDVVTAPFLRRFPPLMG